MTLPRLAVFESVGGGRGGNHHIVHHMVQVTGDENRLVCIRQVVKYGKVVAPETKVTCNSCKAKGWAMTLGDLRYHGDRAAQIKAQDRENARRAAAAAFE